MSFNFEVQNLNLGTTTILYDDYGQEIEKNSFTLTLSLQIRLARAPVLLTCGNVAPVTASHLVTDVTVTLATALTTVTRQVVHFSVSY